MYLTEYEILIIIVEALCGTIGLIGNVLVILVFIRRSVQKPPAVILILSLAMGDVAYSVFGAPLHATAQTYHNSRGNDSNEAILAEDVLCKFGLGVDLAVEYYSILLHGLITINRYFIVCRISRRAMTIHGTLLSVAGIVVISLLVGCFGGITSGAGNSHHATLHCIVVGTYGIIIFNGFLLTVFVTLVLIVILNLKMVLHVRKQQRKTADIHILVREENNANDGFESKSLPFLPSLQDTAITTPLSHETANCPTIPSTPQRLPVPTVSQTQQHLQPWQSHGQPHRLTGQMSRFPREFQRKTFSKMSKTLILSTTTFALIWIMTLGALVIPVDILQKLKHQNDLVFAIIVFVSQLIRFNHCINPVVYGFMCTRFQVEFKRMFGLH